MKTEALRAEHSGVSATPAQLAVLQAGAERGGLAWLTVDLAPAGEKVRFLAECARDLKFPETFGANWDALADCLQDLSWQPAPGYVVRFANAQVFAAAAPRDFTTAVEILEDAARYWRDHGKAFIVLVDGAPALPAFPAT
jgi:RNAse (barnase) inhibitor barstar